jgi:RNA polymerase subunit RPABC4/transcription elongation factor Spt4
MPIYEDDDDFADAQRSRHDDSFDEDPDPRDVSGDDDVKCVHCGRYIHQHAEICPHCRMWQSDDVSRSHKPRWFVITVIFCVAAISGALGIAVAFMLGWRP